MHRSVSAALSAAALLAAAPATQAFADDLPVQAFPQPHVTAATDIVAAGRFQFFADQTGSIGRVAPDGTVVHFPTPLGSPQRLIVGPNGVLWYTVSINGGHENRLGRMTQEGVPLADSGPLSYQAMNMATGADGNVYVTEHTRVAKLSPTGTLITEYAVGAWPRGIVSGPDGNLWIANQRNSATNGASIFRLTPAGATTEFQSGVGPTCPQDTLNGECSAPTDITVGPDGALWYTLSHSQDGKLGHGGIGRISTGGIASYELIADDTAGPTGITVGPDNALYAVDAVRGKIIRTLMFTGEMTETTIDKGGPGASASLGHAGIALGADGKLWVAGNHYDQILRVSPPVPARPTTGNLLTNADGETGPNRRASGNATTVPLAGWATSPNFTAAGFYAHSGDGMMWGGPNTNSSYARQLVDVSAQADDIDGPRRVATLSGQIGGYGGQDDHGTLTARFLSPDGTVLGDADTARVAPGDLPAGGGYVAREIKALLPVGTRFIEVEALAQRLDGTSDDAFFDDLSLTVDPLPAPPLPVATKPATLPAVPTPTTAPKGIPNTGTPGYTVVVATISGVKLAATTLKPVATGGPTTTDPKTGTPISLTLSSAARVTVRFDRATAGRKKAKSCVAPAKAKRGAKACTRYVTRGSFAVDQPAGPSTIRLTGRVNGKPLPRGTYRVVITPAGGASTTVALRVR